MIKEKIIFLSMSAVFISVLVFGFFSQGEKKEATRELLQDIELAAKKTRAKKAETKDKWDVEKVKAIDTADAYKLLLERSPFLKVASEPKVRSIEAASIKKEPPKPEFKYKGRVAMGPKVMVVIEDGGTGKSFLVQEGDMVGDFQVLRIDEKEVRLKKKDGEEVVLNVIKKAEGL